MTVVEEIMSKRARRPVGFYASCLNGDPDPIFRKKYRPNTKPRVMGVYEVERVVAKRLRGNKAEYFVKWKDYSRTENTWEPSEHLPAELIAAFECRSVEPRRLEECRERLELLFEAGLKRPFEYCETLTMSHDVVRSLFPKMPSDLRGSPYLVGEEELVEAGLASSLKKCLTVTGAGRRVNPPVAVKLFIGRSLAFLDKHGHKTARRPVEKVQVKFTKKCFPGTEA